MAIMPDQNQKWFIRVMPVPNYLMILSKNVDGPIATLTLPAVEALRAYFSTQVVVHSILSLRGQDPHHRMIVISKYFNT
jgi:hypothetical protein